MRNADLVKGLCAVGCLFTGISAAAEDSALQSWLTYQRPAEYESLVTDVRPVMRDGVTLDCKIAVPARDGVAVEGKFPGVINNVNPYAALEFAFVKQIEELATLGYQGITCRVRGSGDSEITYQQHGSSDEWNDSYDLVEWLAAQPGSNGRIAFEGASYGGMTSLQAAIQQPPHLVTIVPEVPASDLYLDFIYRGGVKARPYTQGSWAMVTSLMNFPSMSPWKIWKGWYAHPTQDAFWQQADVIHRVDTINIPMLITPGWADDILPSGGVRLYEQMVALGRQDSTWMYVGSWNHDMATFQRNVVIAWLDHWLQQRDDAPLPPSHVVSYEMGETTNPYRLFDTWPPRESESKTLALNLDGQMTENAGVGGNLLFKQGPWSGAIVSPDALTFNTKTLSQDLIIAGDAKLILQARFDQPQANLHVRLFDVDGEREQLIEEGWLNLSHRISHEHPEPLPVNQAVTVEMVVGAIHHRIKAGHQLRMTIAGVNTWDWQAVPKPVNTVVKTGSHGSVLQLDVLPE